MAVLKLILVLFLISSCGFNVELDSGDDSGSDPSGPSGPANTQIPNLLVAAFPGPGIYRENIEATITVTGYDDVFYCLSHTSECCEPTRSYTNAIPITDQADISTYSPGEYCLSFVGVSSGFQTAVQEYQYIIDDQIPAVSTRLNPLIGTNETMFIQTNELDRYIRSDSEHFGSPGYFHSTHNLGSEDPKTYLGCEDVYNSFPFATKGLVGSSLTLETDASTVSQVTTPLKRGIGIDNYGDNFIVSVMRLEDLVNGDTFACNTTHLVLRDFPVFRTSLNNNYTTGSDANDVMYFQGGINYFGRFQGGVTGSTSTPNNPYSLEVNFIDIVN